ncbi:CBS domain-containing protein [Streptomyces sp. Ru87]|uniref:CBS domain-containing protein n=1 Tax=Streptomyces sp. Ru87 TaxID=2044307 RepID=UPI000BF444EF|nr:CBS domain-containing protein [Streptomyces sp. Ru87]PGH47164.1 hypothetical protein CRI70_29840 [Streptomyces sp. Ru87]
MKHRKVGSVMTDDVVRATPVTPFKNVAALLAAHRISGLPVVDDDEKVLGVISETDLMARQAEQFGTGHRLPLTRTARRSAAKVRARTAGELMSTPAVTVRADDSIAQAARTMVKNRVERLPVIDEEDRLVGIVTRRDLLEVFLRPDDDIRAEVADEVLVRILGLPPRAVTVSVTAGVVTLEGKLERSSEVLVAVRTAGQVDGVVAVVNHLTHRLDDTRQRPEDVTLQGLSGDHWIRGL